MRTFRHARRLGVFTVLIAGSAIALAVPALTTTAAAAAGAAARPRPVLHEAARVVKPNAMGELDCNGFSPIQRSVKPGLACTDPRGSDEGRFLDHGHYIGHDEPSMRFLSTRRGSGNNSTITENLPLDPTALPTVKTPGKDVTHWFELTVAPWFSTDVCDPNSAPLLPCTPRSDKNAPHGRYLGGGQAFVELQFYPPGFAPFVDSISCDNTHWCSALTIDSLECSASGACNPDCTEPVNFAFIQTNGVPAGPPSPQLSDLTTVTPNSRTLLMNPGDIITMHMFNAKIPG